MTNKIRFEVEVTECAPIADVGSAYFDGAEIDTSIVGNLKIQLGQQQENFDEVPLLMVSTDILQATWLVLTFRSLKPHREVTIPDHGPQLNITLTPKFDLLVRLIFGQRVVAQSHCEAVYFLQMIGDFHETVVRALLESNPHLINHSSVLRNYPGAFNLAHGV